MPSIVLQLQAECLDSSVSILEILRKALVVARKLSLADAQTWIEKELNGYKSGDKAPPYRLLVGQIKAWNPYHGWIPIMFENAQEANALSKCFLGQPIGELQDLIKNDDATLTVRFDAEVERRLALGMEAPLQPTRHLSRSSIVGVIDAVRTMVLNWCIDLERDGILGEGLVFDAKEKATAAASASSYTIHYHGNVENSQIQQGSQGSSQSMTISTADVKALQDAVSQIAEKISALKLAASKENQARIDLDVIQRQLNSEHPNRIILKESIRSIRNILEGCAGSLLASELMKQLAGLSF